MILVTGANGLLGRSLIRRLVADFEVHAMVRVLPVDPVKEVKYHVVDFGGEWTTEQLPESFDTIVHLAQSSHFREFPERALDVFRVNVESTIRLLDYAFRTGVRRFVNASSGGIYGSGNRAFDENAPIAPPERLSHYLGSKLCGEVLTQSYATHMQVAILRYFFIYGRRQRRSMLLPRLVDNVIEGRPIMLQGERGIRINPIHVSDAVGALVAVFDSEESATFNVGGTEVLSLFEICETIGQRLGVEPRYERVEGEGGDLVGDVSAMREKLYVPKVRFEEGVEDLLP